jgi:nucleobase:cation symporter-1, NCS1 family
VLCVYLVVKAGGLGNVSLNLSTVDRSFAEALPVMIAAIAVVVSYFSGPMLNFGEFSRYTKSFKAVRRGTGSVCR